MTIPEKNEKFTIKVHGMGSHGEGIGAIDGFTVFIEGVLPGETVEAILTEKHKRYGRASLLRILETSPQRVTPPCPLFGKCGGCQVMHLSYASQLEVKRQKVVDAFERIGKIKGVNIPPCVPSPDPLSYRNKIQLPVRAGDKGLKVGLFAPSSHNLVEVDKCFIHSPIGEAVYQEIRKLLESSELTGYDPYSGTGELRHILIKCAISTNEVLVIFITGDQPSPELRRLSRELMKASPVVKGIVHNLNSRDDNVILGRTFSVMEGVGTIQEVLCNLTFQVSPSSFFQVNPKQAEQLYNKALKLAGCTGEETLVDAYCGVGTLSLIFAPHVRKVIGIECVSSAIMDAKNNAAANGIDNCDFIHGEAEKMLPRIPGIDILLLNPPRKGCDPTLINALAARKPKTILYVSCDPATLARDLGCLIQLRYSIESVQPFDMFPQTAHVETLVKCVLLK